MGEVYQVIYSGDEDPPLQSEIDLWITNYGLSNNTLIPTGDPNEVLNALDRRECVFIVETGCMQVQWKQCGSKALRRGLDQLDIALSQ
jgi:hypothetical protein